MRYSSILTYVLMLALVLLIGACSGDTEDSEPQEEADGQSVTQTEAPTAAETAQPEETATETPVPPTRTPLQRATLPPTWTPTPFQSETPTPTRTPTATQTPIPGGQLQVTPNPACDAFRVDFERSVREFLFGESPTVAWQAVEDAQLYRVRVTDVDARSLHRELLAETSYAIPADVFPSEGIYAWTVEPLNDVGRAMCSQRGGELVAQ